MRRASSLFVFLALCPATWSCGHGAVAPPQPAAAPGLSAAPPPAPRPETEEPSETSPALPGEAPVREPGPPPPFESIGSVMAEHFLITSWARDVVVSGQVDPLREPLGALAAYKYEAIEPGGWLPHIAQLQAAAGLAASAATPDAAAQGVATMARICGECHEANHAGPQFSPQATEVFLPYSETFPERMGRHMWAAEQLWRGLTGPSDASWNAGAVALRDAPVEMDEWLPDEFTQSLAEVRALGEKAHDAASLAERADVYGLLLATCADCHDRFLEHGL